MLCKTSWYSIDVSENDTHFALLQEMSLLSLPFAKGGQTV